MGSNMIITASQFQKLFDEAPDQVAFLQNARLGQLQVVPDLSVREALYHYQRDRKFRPTKREIESDRLKCPYCVSVTMKKVRLRKNESGYTCPRCRWSLHQDDLWKPQSKEEPIVREPGDATDDAQNKQPPEVEMSMDSLVKATPVITMV